MNILIVDCLSVGKEKRRFSRDFIGGGPKLIAGIVNQSGIEDLFIKIKRAEDILVNNRLELKEFDICLISAMTMDFKAVQLVIEKWREINRTRLIIIGGPIASDPSLLNILDIDILISCEGEKKFLRVIDILKKFNFRIIQKTQEELLTVNGIIFRFGIKIFTTIPSEYLSSEEYNRLNDPIFYLKFITNYANYKSARVYVECLRGCSNYYRTKFPLQNKKQCINGCKNCEEGDLILRINCPANIPPGCGFCSTIHCFGTPKTRDAKHIIVEINGLLNLGVRRIVLGGPDFLDYSREFLTNDKILTTPSIPPEPNYMALEALIHQIIDLEPIKEQKAQIFIENVKANLCTERALNILSKIPNSIFSIGCETGSDEFAKKLGRPILPSEIFDVVKRSLRYGIRIQVYFIHSLPGETAEYLKESIDLIDKFYKIGVEKITIYKYQEFPGCPFYDLQNKSQLMNQNNKKLNQLRKKLVRRAINFNRMRKEEMIGGIYNTILAESSLFNKEEVIGYIIKGGPKILIKNLNRLIEEVIPVKIIRVISDKLVEGIIFNQ